MAGSYFFCLLDERGDDRCKLQLDIPESASRPFPLVGALRAALKLELGCSANEIILYEQLTKQDWSDVAENDCRKLIDDEAPFRANLVFVKRRSKGQPIPATSTSGPASAAGPTVNACEPSVSEFATNGNHVKRRSPDCRTSSIQSTRHAPVTEGTTTASSAGSVRNPNTRVHSSTPVNDEGFRKVRRLGNDRWNNSSPGRSDMPSPRVFRGNGRGRSSPLLRDMDSRNPRWADQQRSGGRFSGMAAEPPGGPPRHYTSSRGDFAPHYRVGSHNSMHDFRESGPGSGHPRMFPPREWGAPRPPSPPNRISYPFGSNGMNTRQSSPMMLNIKSMGGGNCSDSGMPPPPPPPGMMKEDLRSWFASTPGRLRRLSSGSIRDLHPLKKSSSSGGGGGGGGGFNSHFSTTHKFWNSSNSRKLEVNQMSLFRLRPGRWAPVVHNLISKQKFLEDLHHVVVNNFDKRGETRLPFRIDSLGAMCITHDVKVPTSYTWKNFRTSRDYKSLAPSHRAYLDPKISDSEGEDSQIGGVGTAGNAEENEIVEQVETTICFIEIGQERLLVFDWYVYTLEYVAEYRERLTHEENPPIFYVYGQPRIGKSICILFLAIAAAFCGEAIYYYCDSKIWELSPRGVIKLNSVDILNCHPVHREPGKLKGFMFAELRIREQEDVLQDLQRVAQHKNLLIVASGVPEPSMIEARRYRADLTENGVESQGESEEQIAAKEEKSVSGVESEFTPFIFVPPPAWHELFALKVLSYSNISREEFEFRYFLFGPIPRNLISENGPFDDVFEAWKTFAIQNKGAHPDACPAPDLLNGEPPRLATLLVPVDVARGVPFSGTSNRVTLTFVSGAAEMVINKVISSLPPHD